MSINKYEENRILSANPVELTQILYDAGVRAVSEARRYLQNGDIASRSREISKVQMILVELSNSLNREKGGQIAERLIGLYEYMVGRLVEAHVEQTEAPLAEVAKLMKTLQESWMQVTVADLDLVAQ